MTALAPLPSPPGDPLDIKCHCADLWAHPAAQLLLGPALHPGGADLTAHVLDRLEISPGAVVLDIGCGPGSALDEIAGRGFIALGVDYSVALAGEASGAALTVAGDAERLPVRDQHVDAALLECVVSAFPDKASALAEAHRVLPVGAPLGLTDMTLGGPLPEPLDRALAWVACAAGALTSDGYVELLEASGFEVEWVEDRSTDLAAMVAKARRRLALFRGASGVGMLPTLEEFVGPEFADLGAILLGHDDLATGSKAMLTQVGDAVRAGNMGYVAIGARAI